jgi:plasmid stabilization system protein ParE
MTANERIDGLFGAVAKEENTAEVLRLVRDLESAIAAQTLELRNMFMKPDEVPDIRQTREIVADSRSTTERPRQTPRKPSEKYVQ